MAKTTNLNIRIDPELKNSAEQLYESFGITISDAVTIFLNKSLMENGLPFELKQRNYNTKTEMAIKEAKTLTGSGFKSASEAFASLDEE